MVFWKYSRVKYQHWMDIPYVGRHPNQSPKVSTDQSHPTLFFVTGNFQNTDITEVFTEQLF